MQIKYNVTGDRRKALVAVLRDTLQDATRYHGAPSFAFQVGAYTVDKNGTVACQDGTDEGQIEMLIRELAHDGFIGERVGTGEGPKVDIAVDPLEGTTLCAKDMPGSIAVMAMAEGGTLLAAPDVYMEKIAVGPGYPKGVVDLDRSPEENIRALAKAKGVGVQVAQSLVRHLGKLLRHAHHRRSV